MPTELEELVEFLHHGNTQIRQIACENLVAYSSTDASIFKNPQFVPIKDLKLLVRDYPPIAKNAITILINLSSHDDDILKDLAEDDTFLVTLLKKVTNPKDTTAHLTSQLLANLSKHPSLSRLLTLELPLTTTSKSPLAINQLLDHFISINPLTSPTSSSSQTDSDPDPDPSYLSYLLTSLTATHSPLRTFLLQPQPYDSLIPLTKLLPFTTHPSPIRRRGIASTIKNICFEINHHDTLLSDDAASGINILPYILLPLAGNEEFSAEDMNEMLPDLQLLPPDKEREKDTEIIVTHLESLMLLTTTKKGREKLRTSGVYPVLRVLHEAVSDEGVREGVERLVNVLMRDEEGEYGEMDGEGKGQEEIVKDREIEEVF